MPTKLPPLGLRLLNHCPMMRAQGFLAICCLLLTTCRSSPLVPTTTRLGTRLPTRVPTVTPTAKAVVLPAAVYHQRGVERQRLGDLEQAGQYFSWAIQRDSTFAPAYVSRGSLYLAEGDLERALEDANAALELEPTAKAYVLRGEILRLLEQYSPARQAFDRALGRDASLGRETFQSRWEVAKAKGDADYLSELGAEYAAAHPDEWLRHYYQTWAPLESGRFEEAIAILVRGIEDSGDQPALLWYLLGRAYTGISAWQEAVVSLEMARELVQAGDRSMVFHTNRPVADLFVTLGRAYLGAGRCADAETMLSYGMSLGAPLSEHLSALEKARICQTATPLALATETPAGR